MAEWFKAAVMKFGLRHMFASLAVLVRPEKQTISRSDFLFHIAPSR